MPNSSSTCRSLSCFVCREPMTLFRMLLHIPSNCAYNCFGLRLDMTRRTVPLGQVIAPPLAEVRATSREIVGDSTKRSLRKVAPDLLDRFCRIANLDDPHAAVEAFARRWGMLGLCGEHGL